MFFDHLGVPTLTSRACLAGIVSCVIVLLLGGPVIRWLAKHFREPVRNASEALFRLHEYKQSTPTLGGLLILGALSVSCLLFANLGQPLLMIALGTVAALAALGLTDDLVKLRTSRRGLPAWAKLISQTLIAGVAAVWIYGTLGDSPDRSQLAVPFYGVIQFPAWAFLLLAVLAIVGTSNAVNLTDGLDGLATGCLACAFTALGVVLAVNQASSPALTSELLVLIAAVIGALVGFLWFNWHPAQVFMGDTGSLPLGGLLGLVAVATRQEWLLVVLGGVFVVEALSVILQVAIFRHTGKRLFRCAPLHHHFQLLGWSEEQIVLRFWTAAAMCALVAVGTFSWNAQPQIAETTTPDAPQIKLVRHLDTVGAGSSRH